MKDETVIIEDIFDDDIMDEYYEKIINYFSQEFKIPRKYLDGRIVSTPITSTTTNKEGYTSENSSTSRS